MSEPIQHHATAPGRDDVARIAEKLISDAWALASDLGPAEQLAFADTLLSHAIAFADEAYLTAEENGVQLEPLDEEPRPIVLHGQRIRVPRFGPHATDSPVDVAVRIARRQLGIPRDANTGQIVAAVAALAARDEAFTAVRKCIGAAVMAAREATAAGVRMPSLAWVLSAAARYGAWELAKRQGGYVLGKRAPHAWVRAVETVQAGDPMIEPRAALRLILAATDQVECHAAWEDVFEQVYDKAKQALRRKRVRARAHEIPKVKGRFQMRNVPRVHSSISGKTAP